MPWKNLGNIFTPTSQKKWIHSHASLPVAHHLGNGNFRIFFSSRDSKNHSHIGYVELDVEKLLIHNISPNPVLSPGPPGSFDQNGLSMGCLIQVEHSLYLYYVGWGKPINGQFNNAIGMAKWDESQQCFVKSIKNPVVGIDTVDSISLSYPFIIEKNQTLIMWYGSHKTWGINESDRLHILKTAESIDGIFWKKNSNPVLEFKDENEFAFSRPSIVWQNGEYKMWFSYKGEGYRIGYAESLDGLHWNRKDDMVNLYNSNTLWASKEVCYPNVFEYKNNLYMLFNGNGYGKTGFALAIWE